MNWSKTFFILMVAVLLLVGVIPINVQGQSPETAQEQAYAKPYPMGSVTVDITAVGVGVGVGVQWGKGVLTYKGKNYTFKVKGMQLASVGISKATAKGEVYNLFGLAEFPGQYAAVGAGATVPLRFMAR